MLHRRTRRWTKVCAAVLSALLVSSCSSTSTDDEQTSSADTSPTSPTSPTAPTATATDPATAVTTSGSGGSEATGTLVLIMVGRQGTVLTSANLESAAAVVRSRLEGLDTDPTVEIAGETLAITLPDSTEHDRIVAEANLRRDFSVYLRPVLDCSAVSPTEASTPSDPVTTTIAPSDPTASELVHNLDGTEACQLGPAAASGEVFEPDTAAGIVIGGTWGVTIELREGEEGQGVWNALAAECYAGAETCPTRRLAIQLDGKILSSPTVNAPTFAGSVEISGQFTEDEAKALAARLDAGTLAFGLVVQSVTFEPD